MLKTNGAMDGYGRVCPNEIFYKFVVSCIENQGVTVQESSSIVKKKTAS